MSYDIEILSDTIVGKLDLLQIPHGKNPVQHFYFLYGYEQFYFLCVCKKSYLFYGYTQLFCFATNKLPLDAGKTNRLLHCLNQRLHCLHLQTVHHASLNFPARFCSLT